ncbi:hypothetical protein J1N35_021323 [Gossypium stocksii]|uniref:Uncharacterized protein n=1 Tax=Gossypium stocksii TaxID=47602 RepID=A0A9D4A1R0_9ROSI|nr:hypothetical protein J1N35_021323 [Gossypium stocksii]
MTNTRSKSKVQLADLVRAFITTTPCNQFFSIIESTYTELTLESYSTFTLQHVMMTHDERGTVTFRLGGLVRYMSVFEFGIALGLYIDEFMSAKNFLRLHQRIYYLPSNCWVDLTASMTPYDVIHSKATSLPPNLQYIHALLAHILTSRGESTAPHRHPEQSSTLALAGQMSLQGISSMTHMRMIERLHGVDPSQYQLFDSKSKNEPVDFTNDVPFLHEDPPHPSPSSHRPISSAATLVDLSKRFNHFKHHCFQRFDSIDATLQ